MQLQVFSLSEIRYFLNSNKIRISLRKIVKLYLAIGSMPFYLEHVQKGESAAVALERMCFEDGGLIKNENYNLYKALFVKASNHEAIIAALTTFRRPLSPKDIIPKSKVQSGGPYNRAMQDLLPSGFIREADQYGRKVRSKCVRLSDEYFVFYYRFARCWYK